MSRVIDVAIRRLSDSGCSEHELRLYLEKEFIAIPDLDFHIDSAIQQLKEQHLVNDFRLASNIAEHYAHKGNCFISEMLSQKGIAEDIITRVLMSLENEDVRALNVARKKIASHWESPEITMDLLQRFLSGRRFSCSVINTVIGQLGKKSRYSVH